ncbi:MAG TPA: 3'-5' exonuclease, partial [Burkholderiaceae bacterium]|nr:3'-5' exonuclease [Burkholderiaceae bacterium]
SAPLWTAREAERAALDATAGEIARLLTAAGRNLLTLGTPGSAPDDPGAQPLEASDIAVLVRTNAQGSRMREALHRRGVGSVELAQESIYATRDAEELDRVLTAILEPARERAVKAALSTQAMGFDATDIDALARDETALAVQAQRFAAWREAWQAHGVAFMLRQWMIEARVAARLLARPDDGERRLTNLLHLVERLHEASADNAQPRTLLRWLQSARTNGIGPTPDETAQLRLESDRHLVQIVTVHKSKGLEYPLVFCPLLWLPARVRPSTIEGLEYHAAEREEVTDGAPEYRGVIDFREALLDQTERDALKERSNREALAEEVRLLYVALTRAAHRCVLVAGCAKQGSGAGSLKATAHAPLNWLVAGRDVAPEDWASRQVDAEAVGNAWRDLAERSGNTIALLPLPTEPGQMLHSPSLAPERLAAQDPPAAVPRAWRIGSFSGLAHGARREEAARERDAAEVIGSPAATMNEVDAPSEIDFGAPFVDAGRADILRFPRGPAAGECIHEVFEHIAFTDPTGWPAVIDAALRAGSTLRSLRNEADSGTDEGTGEAGRVGDPVRGADGGEQALQAAMLQNMVIDVLATPLPLGTPTPLRLATLPTTRRLVEMEFHFGVDHLDTRALPALFAQAGMALPSLAPTSLRGWLKGFIDLVFEHEGRWFVLDWKSNHLGMTPAAYEGAPLERAMRAQAYHLQATIYLLALDRLLRARLVDYDPQRHLGGAVYLFVRGVRPGWRDAQGHPTGLVLHRPHLETLRQLSAWFEGTEAAA